VIIAIDGPAASGKGTLGKRLAAHFGVRHLDTGLIYRAVAKALIDSGQALDDRDAAVAAARALDHQIGDAASIVSAIPEVRAALVAFQRDFAARPPGAVLDGRDIGTVICPDADAKIFVIAAPEERARRRALELRAGGQPVDEAAILTDILRRDERDRSRTVAPLVPAFDAVVLDTTHLDVEQAVAAAIRLIEGVGSRPR
jgi:cytidylate kinase